MYLEHFRISKLPFALTPNTEFYCDLPGSHMALNVLLFGLRSGEGFIKIIGEVGSGKTLLCRKLLNSLDDNFVTAYIPNPDLSPAGLRRALARELGLEVHTRIAAQDLLQLISKRLLELYAQGKRVVLVIDEAQAMSDESLEALRLLTNLETESEKLLHVVLFAQPELDARLDRYQFRQLKQRVTFSHYLSPVRKKQLTGYLCHRLAIAGYTQGSLFTRRATKLLYRSSKGIPRVVNILGHKAMLAAYGKGDLKVNYKAMRNAIKDTDITFKQIKKRKGKWALLCFLLLILAAVIYYQGLITI